MIIPSLMVISTLATFKVADFITPTELPATVCPSVVVGLLAEVQLLTARHEGLRVSGRACQSGSISLSWHLWSPPLSLV